MTTRAGTITITQLSGACHMLWLAPFKSQHEWHELSSLKGGLGGGGCCKGGQMLVEGSREGIFEGSKGMGVLK